jgi:hypothetical protein
LGTLISHGARVVALAGAILAPVLVALDVSSPARTAAVLVLFCLAPGVAALALTHSAPTAGEAGLVLGLSLAATAVLAQVMLVLGVWRPAAATYVLGALCAVPLALRLTQTVLEAR